MKKKLIGILVCMLLIGTIFSVSGNTILTKDSTQLNESGNDEPEWIIQLVDSDGDVGLYSSLSVYNDYQYHSYYDKTNKDLKYAVWDGETWDIDVVDSTGDVGLYSSLDFGYMGAPCISYYDNTNHNLKFAWYDPYEGGNWYTETVDSTGDVGWGSSLKINVYVNDIDDIVTVIRISYYDFTNNQLKYAEKSDDSENPLWHIDIVDYYGGLYNDLSTNAWGSPEIAYTGVDGGVKYSYREFNPDGGYYWVNSIVDSTAEGWDISIAHDQSDRPHISYYKNGKLYHTYKSGGSFTTPEIVDDVTYGGWGSSIATYENEVYISYYKYDTKDLYYRVMSENSGVALLTQGDVGQHSSIFIYDGLIHVSCYDNTNKDLIKVFQQVEEEEGDLFITGLFQPVQTVYPDDPVYGNDIGPMRMIPGDGWVQECDLDMVAGKNTYIFGQEYEKRDKFRILVTNDYKEAKTFHFTLSIQPDNKEIWRSPNPVTVPAESETLTFTYNTPIPDKPFQWEKWSDDTIKSKEGKIILSVDPKPSPDWKNQNHVIKLNINKTHNLKVVCVAWTFRNGPDFPLVLKNHPTAYDTYIKDELKPWWQSIYPLAEDELTVYRTPVNIKTGILLGGKKVDSLKIFKNDLNNLERLKLRKILLSKSCASTWTTNQDRAVYIVTSNVSDGAYGLAHLRQHDGKLKYGVIVAWNDTSGNIIQHYVPAHEVGHTYGLDDNYDYSLTPPKDGEAAPGYWVNENKDVPNDVASTRDLMGFVDYIWNDAENQRTWIKKPNYKALLKRFTLYKDPEVLGISGFINKNNDVELNPWYQLDEGNIDLEWDTTGDYQVKAYNSNNVLLKTAGFSLSFTDSQDFTGEKITDETVFAFRLEWINAIDRIDIIHKATNQIIASRTKSQHPPQITITSPQIGQELKPEPFTITWEGNDNDGDQLTYNIAYSNDSGETWTPICDTTTDNTYDLDFSNLEKDNYKLKVFATDGWNVEEDTVNFAIKTVKTKNIQPRYNFTENLLQYFSLLFKLLSLFNLLYI